MRITFSELKDSFVKSGKGLITSLSLKAKARPKKCKNSRYAIRNISMKYLSKIIREFEELPYKLYERRRPKHNPTDSYFKLARHIAEYMMRADTLNLYNYPERMEMTGVK